MNLNVRNATINKKRDVTTGLHLTRLQSVEHRLSIVGTLFIVGTRHACPPTECSQLTNKD